ncbi:argininosuccinate synthase, chloroplastic-like isoform X2 [Castanea sativa]|uniref:argininosuccinate synthase, chloroplastic-like isoform X2 n=1 Tax=Castanea sativa TaxID=21020 RepID=UPI003F64E9BD
MGCICGKPSATDSPRNRRPRQDPCFRFIRKIPFQLVAQTSKIHGHAVATISNGGGVTKFCKNQEVLQSRKMEVSEATKGRGLHGKLNNVVQAYYGGLNTSVIVPWLRENYGCDFVCSTADVGQAMVDIAKEARADAVSHGCTGKGHVQVHFELPFFALNPKLNVVDPCREWDIIGREDAIEYAKKHNVPIPVTKKSIYSGDRNLWHLSHEGDILEDLANKPKKDMYMLTVDPEEAQDKPEYIEIGIESGLPVSVNGKELSPASLLVELNKIGGKYGIGQIDMVENRLVGVKSHEAYETLGGTILFNAIQELESLIIDQESMQLKDSLALKYAELISAGRWFDPLHTAMEHLWKKSLTTTDSVSVTGRRSPYSLSRLDNSSFESNHKYDQADAAGFIQLYGLPNFQ